MNLLQRVKTSLLISTALSILIASVSTHANMVIVSSDSNIQDNTNFFDSIFEGENVYSRFGTHYSFATTNWAGVATETANSYDGSEYLAESALDGVDWLIAGSATLYTGDELNYIDHFIAGGGNLWVVGEGSYYSEINESANQLLSHIGSSMSVSADHTNKHAYTADRFGMPNDLAQSEWAGIYAGNIVGGEALYKSKNRAVLAFESTATVSPVPVPGSLLLFGTALMGFGVIKRRKSV